MTTPAEAEQAIYSQFVTEWGARTPFAFQEERVPSTVSIGETSWVYVFVTDIASPYQTLGEVGNRRYLRQAQVQISIYTPQGHGTQEAMELAHHARAVFEGNRVSSLFNFKPADITRLGPKPPEYVVAVVCPFEYQETK